MSNPTLQTFGNRFLDGPIPAPSISAATKAAAKQLFADPCKSRQVGDGVHPAPVFKQAIGCPVIGLFCLGSPSTVGREIAERIVDPVKGLSYGARPHVGKKRFKVRPRLTHANASLLIVGIGGARRLSAAGEHGLPRHIGWRRGSLSCVTMRCNIARSPALAARLALATRKKGCAHVPLKAALASANPANGSAEVFPSAQDRPVSKLLSRQVDKVHPGSPVKVLYGKAV